jgi:hypothetical protein
MAKPDIQIFPKTELQEDWYTKSTTNLDSYVVNLDRNGELAISFHTDRSIFNAYHNVDKGGNTVKAWTMDDTNSRMSKLWI